MVFNVFLEHRARERKKNKLLHHHSYFYGLFKEGDMGVYGIAVLGSFSCGISVILILTCGNWGII